MASDRLKLHVDRLLAEIDGAVTGRNWYQVRHLALDVLVLDPENTDALAFQAAAERALAIRTPDHPTGTLESPTSALESTAPQPPVSFAGGRFQVKGLLSSVRQSPAWDCRRRCSLADGDGV